MKPAVGQVKWLVAALAIRRSHCQRYARPLHLTTKSWSDRELRPHQAKLRRRRDFARQRWPFGQHKVTVCLVAWTAMPESLRRFRWWPRPMISCRDEVSALTTTVAAQSVPRDANALWPGSDEDLRWRPGASLACHFARSITNKLSKVDPQAASAAAMAAPMPIEAAVTSAVCRRSPRMCRLSCRSRLRPLGWWDGIDTSV